MWRTVFCAALSAMSAYALAASAPRSTTIAFSADGTRLVALNRDSGTATVIDAARRVVIAEVRVCGEPETVSIDSLAHIACADGTAASLALDPPRVLTKRDLGVPLFGVVSAGQRLYVTSPAAGRVLVLDSATLAISSSIPSGSLPRGLALSETRLLVTHFATGAVTIIDTASGTVLKSISTGDNNLSQSIWLHGTRAYLPQTRSNSGNTALLFDTTVFPIVSVIDAAAGENLPRERLPVDIADRPVNMPLDAVVTSDGRIWIVNAGSDDVSVIDISRRTGVGNLKVGSHPRGAALSADERSLWINNALSGSVSVIDTTLLRVVDEISITTIPLPPAILNGKRIFHTSNRTDLARDRWISCATCHFDGGADGRTWFFRDGPRNSTALFGLSEAMPLHWSGDLDELQDVESTIRVIQAGTGLAPGASNCDPTCDKAPPNSGRSQDLDDLAAFMRFLKPPRHPGFDRDAAARGYTHFVDPRSGCASCHIPPLYTDRLRHDVATGRSSPLERKGTSFDTPSLRGAYLTAPYMHDGSATTLLDVVNGATGSHGDTRHLDAAQKNDLVEFLRSIDFATPRRRAVR